MKKDLTHFPALPRASRRNFLGATASAAGGIFFPKVGTQLEAAPDGGVGETDHFYYRLAPAEGPWIDTQRDNKAFGFRDGKLFLSEDNSRTWTIEADFADAENILFSCFLKNGNLVFATQRKIYLSTDNLSTYREITVLNRDGSDYEPHTLREGEVPGWYFYSLDGIHTHEVKDVGEMLIWGNYCNVRTGPTPSNIYYSTDGGETIKVAYSFGQNPAFQHKDADPDDRTNWVGNPDNPTVCRHIHSVTYNPAENAFYACSGDIDRKNGAGLECHWLRGTYDAAIDEWNWKIVVSADANSRFKSGGMNFVDGQIYWVADANGPKTLREVYDRGIFCCAPEDIPDKSKHIRIYPAEYEIACMTIHGEQIVVPKYGNADPFDCGFLFSPDLGQTWGHYDLKEFGDRSGVRVNPPNGEGWFRVGLRARWLDRAEVLFLKSKG